MDISSLNLDALQALANDIKAEIKLREVQEVAKARDQILAIAHSVGMTVDAIVKNTDKKNAKVKVAAKYRNPQSPNQEWTGRGRQPKWVKEWLDGGRTVSELAI